MYSIRALGSMYANKARFNAYYQALSEVITPESVVLDIGAGTGIFSLIACELGARQVFAVEPDPSIQVARELIEANGFGDRVDCYESLSTQITIPQKADVLVADLSGGLPYFLQNIPSIVDARQRLLTSDAVIIAAADRIYATVIETSNHYRKLLEPWQKDFKGIDLRGGLPYVVNEYRSLTDESYTYLARPKVVAEIDYATIEKPDLRTSVNWSVDEAGMGHGIAIWMDREVGAGIEISNALNAPVAKDVSAVYGRIFLPWLEAVALEPGDTISLDLRADFVADDYVWSWSTMIIKANSDQVLRFRQSTVLGAILTPASLAKQRNSHLPLLNDKGAVQLEAMQMMNGDHSLASIARHLTTQFPDRFKDSKEALTFVTDLSLQFSR